MKTLVEEKLVGVEYESHVGKIDALTLPWVPSVEPETEVLAYPVASSHSQAQRN